MTAFYDNLYSKQYINKAGYCQKIVEYIMTSVDKIIDGASYLESTKREFLEKGDTNLFSFYNNIEYKRWKETCPAKENKKNSARNMLGYYPPELWQNKAWVIMEGSDEDSDESDTSNESDGGHKKFAGKEGKTTWSRLLIHRALPRINNICLFFKGFHASENKYKSCRCISESRLDFGIT